MSSSSKSRRFRVLAEPTRIRLLDLLRRGEASVQQLAGMLGSTQQNVSIHLGVLRQEGIVRRTKLGNYSYYAVAGEGIFELCEHVCDDLANQHDSLYAIVAAAEEGAVRPTRPVRRAEPSLSLGRKWKGGGGSDT